VLHIELFGEFSVKETRGRPLHFGTRKAQWLFAYLVLHSGPHTRERLATLFWPDASESNASNSLRQALHNVKMALKPAGLGKKTGLIVSKTTAYVDPECSCRVDCKELTQLLKKCERAPEEDRPDCLRRAIALYRGDLLEGCDDFWCQELRAYYQDLYLKALMQLTQIYTKQEHYAQAMALCKEILAKSPLHEETHRHLVYLHFMKGDRSAALRHYGEVKRILKKELGVDPQPETTALYLEIEARTRPAHLDRLTLARQLILRDYPELGAPFVGRTYAWSQLQRVWKRSLGGQGNTVFIEGEAGIGKSRLSQEFLTRIKRLNAFVFSGRSYEIEGKLPFRALIEALRQANWALLERPLNQIASIWLSEVAKLLPELADKRRDLTPGAPLSSPESEQIRLLEGLSQFFFALAQARPVLLFLDDLQWSDESTLLFVQHFMRRLSDKPILLMGAFRPEEIDSSHDLWKLLQPGERDGQLLRIHLDAMDSAEVHQLVQGMLRTDRLVDLGHDVYAQSQGVPLVAVELLKLFLEVGALRLDHQDRWAFDRKRLPAQAIPRTVRALVETRLRRLGSASRQALDAAAVLGRGFDADVLRRVLKREDLFSELVLHHSDQ
jgi:DNA-binding SARP family transcriptional activator